MVGAATFSDRWHLVAELHVGLLPTVRAHRQIIRQQVRYVLTEPYSQRYFQISEEAYFLLTQLTPQQSVATIWNRLVERAPEQAPGQEEVVQLLAQLHQSNLLYVRSRPDSHAIFTREQSQRRRELRGKLLSFLFIRIPIFDPNRWLASIRPLFAPLISAFGLVVWLLVVAGAVFAILPQSHLLYAQTEGILALENLPWLYLCLFVLKTCHELAHAIACKHYGGDVHTLGVMLLVFMPLPYMDATSSWSFRKRRQRVVVSSAGVVTELFLAALAAIVWSFTGGGLVHSLAFNIMLIGSVSSLLFNGNPLLRYDAYYVLSDLLDIPNLSIKSSQYWQYLLQRYLMGSDQAISPATDPGLAAWLFVYGVLSTAYRMLVTIFILMMVLDKFFALGLILLGVSVWMWGVQPLWKVITYLLSPQVYRHRQRAWIVSGSLVVLIIVLVTLVPLPASIRAPGVVEALDTRQIIAPVQGFLQRAAVHHGQRVVQGQILLELENTELATELQLTRHLLTENALLLRRALWDAPADMDPLNVRSRMLQDRLTQLEEQHKKLTVYAPVDGVFVAPDLHERQGAWFPRGEIMARIVGQDQYRFTAAVVQDQARQLFRLDRHKVRIRLHGQAGTPLVLDVSKLTLIPFHKDRLASAALGWGGGGAIAVTGEDKAGVQTVEGFFEVRAQIPDDVNGEDLRLMHGVSGKMWIQLEPEPLVQQARRNLQQLLQKRYGLTL